MPDEKSIQPEQPNPSPDDPAAQKTLADSRRQFVRKLTRRAAYVTPVVIALASTKQAFGSGPSGGPS